MRAASRTRSRWHGGAISRSSSSATTSRRRARRTPTITWATARRSGCPGQQEELALQVAATGKPVVLVLINGRPQSIPKLVPNVPAILEGWYLGQETGTAVADVLFGDVNPGGKLPVTVARDVGQLPVFYNYKPTARRGYVLDSITPLFPFGYGLSYTTFTYSNLRADGEPHARRRAPTSVTVDVTQHRCASGRRGRAAVHSRRVSARRARVKELRGFQRVTLAARRDANRDVRRRRGDLLAYHGPDMKRVVEPGEFQIMVGGSSVDLKSIALTVDPATVGPSTKSHDQGSRTIPR